jgi:hypothetical protein
MNLVAQVTIDRYRVLGLDPHDLKKHVTAELANILTNEIIKNMTITSTKNIYDDSTTYIGTLATGAVGSNITGAVGSNITGAIIGNNYNTYKSGTSAPIQYSQIDLRVVEYTKNKKVTRVELQKYDESTETWNKIPRIQIEE